MNNLEKYQQKVTELEAEIVGYRLVLESIRMIARQAGATHQEMPPGPLFQLVCKVLQEKDGSEIQTEFTLLRMLESGMRRENDLAKKRPDENSKEFSVQAMQIWNASMDEIITGNFELMMSLDKLRLLQRQREASRVILPS
jgi:hypothetical protein